MPGPSSIQSNGGVGIVLVPNCAKSQEGGQVEYSVWKQMPGKLWKRLGKYVL
jgi:hypothetical protein